MRCERHCLKKDTSRKDTLPILDQACAFRYTLGFWSLARGNVLFGRSDSTSLFRRKVTGFGGNPLAFLRLGLMIRHEPSVLQIGRHTVRAIRK